jgi:F-type H+-transporting ATPase subunit b
MSEAATARSEVPGQSAGFPPFQQDTYPSQLFWLAVCFVLLYALMLKVVIPRIKALLTDRRLRIADDVESAQRFKRESAQIVAAYQSQLMDARQRASTLVEEAQSQIKDEAEHHQDMVDKQFAIHVAASGKTIAEAKAKALGSLHSIAAEAASAIMERLTGAPMRSTKVSEAVGRALRP